MADIQSHKSLQNLCLPIFVAPMFLVSGPELVISACHSNVIGSFPAANARTSELLEDWLKEISGKVDAGLHASWAINLVTNKLNKRLAADLTLTCKYKAPIVITALGHPGAVVDQVHSYGGLVFADVATIEQAKKAAATGVDGLILIASGAGGHTGSVNGFSFVAAVREFWQGLLVLGGGIGNGEGILASQALGADFAYMGTTFIGSHESMAKAEYKVMLVESVAKDIINTDAFTGIPNNMLRPSIEKAGFDPDNIPSSAKSKLNFDDPHNGAKAWRDIWSAGHGVGQIKKVRPVKEIVTLLQAQYLQGSQNINQNRSISL